MKKNICMLESHIICGEFLCIYYSKITHYSYHFVAVEEVSPSWMLEHHDPALFQLMQPEMGDINLCCLFIHFISIFVYCSSF